MAFAFPILSADGLCFSYRPANRDGLCFSYRPGKAIPMRPDSLREQTRKAAEQAQPKMDKRRSKGERTHRKRMAAVAALYSVAPFVRTPEDIIKGLALKPGEVGPRRPAPVDKRVWASVAHPSEAVATELFAEAQHRQAQQARRWVVLVDGNEAQLTNLLALGDLHGVKLTVIIDVIHVIEYLWRAGMAFEREANKELEAWVRSGSSACSRAVPRTWRRASDASRRGESSGEAARAGGHLCELPRQVRGVPAVRRLPR
jgi:hypothetical protein